MSIDMIFVMKYLNIYTRIKKKISKTSNRPIAPFKYVKYKTSISLAKCTIYLHNQYKCHLCSIELYMLVDKLTFFYDKLKIKIVNCSKRIMAVRMKKTKNK